MSNTNTPELIVAARTHSLDNSNFCVQTPFPPEDVDARIEHHSSSNKPCTNISDDFFTFASRAQYAGPRATSRVPHEVWSYIIQHATGYVPSFGFDTTFQSPFSCIDDSQETYHQELNDAMRVCLRLENVNRMWRAEVTSLQERHALLVEGECDWDLAAAAFERRNGSTTRRITIDVREVTSVLAKHIGNILETLSDVRVISFRGRIHSANYRHNIDYLQGVMNRVAIRNSQHITSIAWSCLDIDIMPLLPMCGAIEKLFVQYSGKYSTELLSTLDGATLTSLHSLFVRFPVGDGSRSNLCTLLASWYFPSLRAFTIASETPPTDLRSFLRGSGNKIEFLRITEKGVEEDEFIPLPVLPSLQQLEVHMEASKQLLSTSQPNLIDLGLFGYSELAIDNRFMRRSYVRSLVQAFTLLKSPSIFPCLRLVCLDDFYPSYFNKIRWTPYEQSALHYVSRILSMRNPKVKWEDCVGNDMHKAISKCIIIMKGHPDYSGVETVEDLQEPILND